jgi:hypothetical protein
MPTELNCWLETALAATALSHLNETMVASEG